MTGRAVMTQPDDRDARDGANAPAEHVRTRCPALIATLVAMARASEAIDGGATDELTVEPKREGSPG